MIRAATAADVAGISRAMAAAFEYDPVASWFWRDAPRRREHLTSWYRLVAEEHYLEHGRAFIAEEAGEVVGCSMWSPPGEWRFSPRTELRATWHSLPRIGWRRVPIAAVGMWRIERRHPAEPHWYLSELGVRPQNQGQGLGSQLMFEVLALCDRAGVPAYLESSTEGSRALYARQGFELADTIRMPRGGPPLWLMWRSPGKRLGDARHSPGAA